MNGKGPSRKDNVLMLLMLLLLLHQIMSVRIVFGCMCDDSKLELRGVHQDHHHHGRSYARTIGFSIEMDTSSMVIR